MVERTKSKRKHLVQYDLENDILSDVEYNAIIAYEKEFAKFIANSKCTKSMNQ